MGLGWWVCFAPKSVGRGVQVLGWMKLQVPYPNCRREAFLEDPSRFFAISNDAIC